MLALGALAIGVFAGYSLALSHVRDARSEAATAREELARLAAAHDKLQERNWTLYMRAQEATPGPTGGGPPDSGVYTDGVYLVPTDIEPGTCRGRVTGDFGYWARLNATTGVVSAIVANDIVRGPFVLTILPRDAAVELRGVTLTAEE